MGVKGPIPPAEGPKVVRQADLVTTEGAVPRMSRAGSRPHSPVRLVLALCVLVLTGLCVPTAGAVPAPTVKEVRARIAALHAEAEAATERYDAVHEQMTGLDLKLSVARTKLDQEHKALTAARKELARWAAEQYKAGDLSTLALLLSDDADRFLQNDGLYRSLAEQRTTAVSGLVEEQRSVLATTTDIQEQQQQLERSRHDLDVARQDVERKLADAERELARLTGPQRAQLAAADEADDRQGLSQQGVTLPPGRRATCQDVAIPDVDARVAKVISYACAQLGDPYRWGASGPSRFDCSGLVLAAWGQAGVSLPHNAASQASAGRPVGRSDLRPGDVVFFYRPIGHDGIYIGNGLMIHAPRTGDSVKIAPVGAVGSYTTAARF